MTDINTPRLETKRLILRRFREEDADALLLILRDPEVNTFLPWFPLQTRDEAAAFLREHYLKAYEQPRSNSYAICLKEDDAPIGYAKVDEGEAFDLGYGLRREFWHRGIVTEAAGAVLEQAKRSGVPFLTATHDVNNPRSGAVMKKLGLSYRYSYEEQWQPKDFPVVFRMYQMNFDRDPDWVYRAYWEKYPKHFVESGAF